MQGSNAINVFGYHMCSGGHSYARDTLYMGRLDALNAYVGRWCVLDGEVTRGIFDRCHAKLALCSRYPRDHGECTFWKGEIAASMTEENLP